MTPRSNTANYMYRTKVIPVGSTVATKESKSWSYKQVVLGIRIHIGPSLARVSMWSVCTGSSKRKKMQRLSESGLDRQVVLIHGLSLGQV